MKTSFIVRQYFPTVNASYCKESFKKKPGKISFLTVLFFFLYISLSGSSFAQEQWTQVGNQLTGLASGVQSISVVDSNIVWIGGGTDLSPSEVYRTTDGGLNWVSLPTAGLSNWLTAIAAKDSLTAFVGDTGGPDGNPKLYKTTDAGLNWVKVDSSGGTAGFYNDIEFSKSNPQFGIAMCDPADGPGGAFIVNKTTDGGITWVRTNPPGVPNSYGWWNTAYAIDPMFYGFASVSHTSLLMTSYTTNNGGASWILGNGVIPLNPTHNTWGDIVFNDDKQHGVMCGDDLPNIRITSNGGNDWDTINTNTDINYYSKASWVSGTNTVFICSSYSQSVKKIIRSDDNGLHWRQQDTPNLFLHNLDYIRYGETLIAYAISREGYVIKSTQRVSITTPVELEQSSPVGFSLEQSYPNPFNPSTKITYSVAQKSQVLIKVYDVLGNEIETLVDGEKPAGEYEIIWNAANLPNGVYFYQLKAGRFIETKKMVLLK